MVFNSIAANEQSQSWVKYQGYFIIQYIKIRMKAFLIEYLAFFGALHCSNLVNACIIASNGVEGNS